MAARFNNPFPQFWSSSAAYVGGTLNFYITGTSTPLAVYSDETLVTSIGTSVALNSAGRAATNIFLQNASYKVVLQDSNSNVIWTADPVRPSDFLSFPKWNVGSGSPNGVVAGTAGSSGIMPDKYWDYTNSIEYTCTTTGSSSTALWTALNAAAATPAVPPPQGYITPVSATPVITSDSISATSIYYTPDNGNLIPIYNGSSFTPTVFSELTLALVSQHAINTLYDLFVFSNSGVMTFVTGPAWSVSTAGSCARGTGASTTQLARVQGLYTNAVSMTGRNGSTTYTIGANLATYVGSLFIDGTAGQVTNHVSFGQSRKRGLWNGYNKRPLLLKAGDGTSSWTYNSATVRPSNNNSANSLSLFCGLAEESVELRMIQNIQAIAGAAVTSTIGIGYNSTTAQSGLVGKNSGAVSGGLSFAAIMTFGGLYIAPPAIGLNTITALESGSASNIPTFLGGEDDMALLARWLG